PIIGGWSFRRDFFSKFVRRRFGKRRAGLEACPTMRYSEQPSGGCLRQRIISSLVLLATAACAQVTSPEKYFGFQLGADKKMARWDKIVDYFGVLEKESAGKMKVINMGPSTMGNPFLMVIITSPANHAKMERLRQVNL